MSQVDEGLIHAWLDGQLPPGEAARVEQMIATDAAWSAAAAEARGISAGASRILGALDYVPSVRTPGVSGKSKSRRPLWREPWVGIAAMVLLAVGVGSVVVERFPNQENVAALKAPSRTDSVVAAPAASPQNIASAPRQAARTEGVTAKTETHTDQLRGGASGNGAGAPAPVAGGAVATAANAKSTVRDTAKVDALALQKPIAGARAMSAVAETRERPAEKTATDQLIVDVRIAGCWLATDTAPDHGYVLKFADPVATDVQRAAAPPVVQRRAQLRPLSQSPAGARVQGASPRAFNADSTFRAEWIAGDARMSLLFTVRGDTLTGATHRAAGDVVYPGVPFRAVRVQCPQ